MKALPHSRRRNLFYKSSRKLRTEAVIKGRKILRGVSGHLHSQSQLRLIRRTSERSLIMMWLSRSHPGYLMKKMRRPRRFNLPSKQSRSPCPKRRRNNLGLESLKSLKRRKKSLSPNQYPQHGLAALQLSQLLKKSNRLRKRRLLKIKNTQNSRSIKRTSELLTDNQNTSLSQPLQNPMS